MGKLYDLKNQRFGRLLVLERAETYRAPKGGRATMWKCKCDCGKIVIVASANLRRGFTKSCGCLTIDNFKYNNPNKKHGESNTRLYEIWEGIHKRCEDVKRDCYCNYGGRGIIVCEEWKNYEVFRDWALKNGYEDTLSIDRIDVDGNYCPDNCRWSTKKQQANNRRSNKFLTYKGITHTIAEWSELLNIPYSRIQGRIKSGWDVDDIFETPKLKARREYGQSSIV